ncbi:helix-turn-helix transcriptional regulator [Streptomyces sp. NPDC051162]|uniref:helix-turn-helix domain-containing protein n=1 Tax=unclassified Streptomyces TaxID=2593676 RepID=UPI00344714EA
MTSDASNRARVVPLRPAEEADSEAKEPLWRHIVGDVLRRERHAQDRTLKDVADAARISMPYLSELERGRKEASSEMLAAAARALGLGLTDLLALVQGELARTAAAGRGSRVTSFTEFTERTHRRTAAPAARRQGEVRLAA